MKTPIEVAGADVFALRNGSRVQWEEAQGAHVLLYPEGMVKLSESAWDILRRVDGRASVEAVIEGLELAYPGAELREDVTEFIRTAHERGWIVRTGR